MGDTNMDFAARRTPAVPSHFGARDYDGWVMFGYVAFAIIALVAIYFASGGPGLTEAEIAIATIMP